MIKWLCKLFKRKKYIVPPIYPYYDRCFPRMKMGKIKKERRKEYKPMIPGTFVYPDSWYKSWNKNLRDIGWTKKELKQGWRWIK